MLYQPSSQDIPYTGNFAADGVLFYYMSLAREEGIKTDVFRLLSGVALPDVELCTFLGNALDNALAHAAEKRTSALYTLPEGRRQHASVHR